MKPSGLAFLARLVLGLFLAFLATTAALSDEPTAPVPPKEYKVFVNYSIRAGRNARVVKYFALTKQLTAIGFKKDEGLGTEPEDADHTLMTGTIASGNARKILADRHVKCILLMPAGYEIPAEADKMVKVQLDLSHGLDQDRQRLLAGQTVEVLKGVGFSEAVGYDHRGYSRIIGSAPAGQLTRLLEDLRWQASGWLVPGTAVAELPYPIKSFWPVMSVEILPNLEPARELTVAAESAADDSLQKISPDLRAAATQQNLLRLEVLLRTTPNTSDINWFHELESAVPGISVEGHLGQIVTVRGMPAIAANLARLPFVSNVRLPRSAQPGRFPIAPSAGGAGDSLRARGIDRLQRMGEHGRGVHLVLIDSDFRGVRPLIGSRLPATTKLVDLAAECSPDVQSPAEAFAGSVLGHGTQCALAAVVASPAVELTLVRIDDNAPFQLLEVARSIQGEAIRTESLDHRLAEITLESVIHDRRNEEMLAERKKVLDMFGQDETTIKQREDFFKREAGLAQERVSLEKRQRRYFALLSDLQSLRSADFVACPLTWGEGYAADGSSELSRYLAAGPFRSALWFQATGDYRGQSWGGLYRDADGNGVMEFAQAGTRLKPGKWTSELNFLGWQAHGAAATQDLPQGKFRLAMQWREPHEPEFWRTKSDAYRTPVAKLQLVVLRQRDPSGSKVATDDLEVVARSNALPQRIENQETNALYEQSLELAVASPGRFTLRIEGGVPETIRPHGEPTVPAQRKRWELTTRILVTAADEATAAKGRPIFWDFSTDEGSLSMPADAKGIFTVGAVDQAGKRQSYSSGGPVLGQELHQRPELVEIDFAPLGIGGQVGGTGMATAQAAGIAANLQSSGIPKSLIVHDILSPPGDLLQIPQLIRPKTKR